MRGIDDSAQLILVAGFTIGLVIVVSTVMLNSIIYAGNTASDSSINADRFESSNVAKMTDDAIQTAYKSSMEGGSFNETHFNQYMDSYGNMISDIYSLSGTSISMASDGNHTNVSISSGTETSSVNIPIPQP